MTTTKTTYVQTLNGVKIVIKNVPAVILECENEVDCGFTPEVAERLESILNAIQISSDLPGAVVTLDYEVIFGGEVS